MRWEGDIPCLELRIQWAGQEGFYFELEEQQWYPSPGLVAQPSYPLLVQERHSTATLWSVVVFFWIKHNPVIDLPFLPPWKFLHWTLGLSPLFCKAEKARGGALVGEEWCHLHHWGDPRHCVQEKGQASLPMTRGHDWPVGEGRPRSPWCWWP